MLKAEKIKEERHTGKANEGRSSVKERQKLSRSGARRDVTCVDCMDMDTCVTCDKKVSMKLRCVAVTCMIVQRIQKRR